MTPDHAGASAHTQEHSDVLVTFILEKFDGLVDLVGSLDDATANSDLTGRVPAGTGTNSPVQLLVHVCGMLRRWSSTVNLGVTVPRDREAEFTARMPVAEVLESAARTRRGFLDDVAATVPYASPAAVPPGRGHFWTGSCHGVLLHVLEEISQHLGHAEITRDVLSDLRDLSDDPRPSPPPAPGR
ncbi:mycothiol transferase [Nesterenkonia suensis]